MEARGSGDPPGCGKRACAPVFRGKRRLCPPGPSVPCGPLTRLGSLSPLCNDWPFVKVQEKTMTSWVTVFSYVLSLQK